MKYVPVLQKLNKLQIELSIIWAISLLSDTLQLLSFF